MRIEESNKAIDRRMMNEKYDEEYHKEWHKAVKKMGKDNPEEN